MDPLEVTYDTMDAVPEAYRGLYEERDGKAQLTGINGLKTQRDVDNVQEALRKERNDHRELRSRMQPLAPFMADEDTLKVTLEKLDAFDSLKAQAEAAGDPKKLEEAVSAKLNQHVAPLNRQITELKTQAEQLAQENGTLKSEIHRRDLNGEIDKQIDVAKALPEAREAIRQVVGSMMERTEDGKYISSEKSGLTPGLGMADVFKELRKSHFFFFPQSEGGGARPGSGVNGYTGVNPFKADSWNMTEQGRVYRDDPQLAARLAKAAGTTVGGTPNPNHGK